MRTIAAGGRIARAASALFALGLGVTCGGGPGGADAATGETGGDGSRAFGERCATDGECGSGACFLGAMGSYCSTRCATDAECPRPPSDGTCNMKGYCRKP